MTVPAATAAEQALAFVELPDGQQVLVVFEEKLHPRDRKGRFTDSPNLPNLPTLEVGGTPVRPGDVEGSPALRAKFRDYDARWAEAADKLGIDIDNSEQQGFWDGEEEPSIATRTEADPAKVEAASALIGEHFHQDAMAVFRYDDDGPDARFAVRIPKEIDRKGIGDLIKYGMPEGQGASVQGDTAYFYAPADEGAGWAENLAEVLDSDWVADRGHFTLLSDESYGDRTYKQAIDASPEARSLQKEWADQARRGTDARSEGGEGSPQGQVTGFHEASVLAVSRTSRAAAAWQRGEAVRAADFKPNLHPRDHKGRFTDKPDVPDVGFGSPLTKADAFVGQRVTMLSDTVPHDAEHDSGRGTGTIHFVIEDRDAYTKGETLDPTLAPKKGAKWAVRVQWPTGASTVEDPAKLTPISDPTAVRAKILDDEDQKQALFGYEDGGYINTNSLLRRGHLTYERSTVDEATRAKVKKTIPLLDKAIDEQPPLDHAVTVFRGAAGEHFKDAKAGDTLTDKGFMSASLLDYVAKGFSRGDSPAYVTITVPKGMKVLNVNGARNNWNDEEEVVFPRGTKFIVESITTRPDAISASEKRIFVHLHAEPPDA